MKRSVLLIARHFPPEGGGGVQRPSKLAKYLAREGWGVRVIAAPPPAHANDPSLIGELPAGVEIHRLRVGAAARLRDAAAALRLGRVYRLLTKNVMLGDSGALDLAETAALAVRAGASGVSGAGVSAVIATSLPFSSVIAGAIAAERLGVPLIADLRDPWAYAPLGQQASPVHAAVMRRIESWTLARAARVIVVTEPMLGMIPPEVRPNTEVIPNGFDPEDFVGPPEARDTSGAPRFRVVYCGSFYGNRIRPFAMLEALALLEPRCKALGRPLEVVIAGSLNEYTDALRSSALPIELRGYRPHKETVALLRSADAILVLVEPYPELFHTASAKVYEAIAAGPPVVALVPKGSVAEHAVVDTGAGRAVTDAAGLARELALVLEGKASSKPLAERTSLLAQYDRRSIARRFMSLID